MRTTFCTIRAIAIAAGLASAAAPSWAQAPLPGEEILSVTVVAPLPDTVPWVAALPNVFLRSVAGQLVAGLDRRLSWGGAFGEGGASPGTILPAMGRGDAQIGTVLIDTATGEVPLVGVAAALPFVSTNPSVAARAMDETHATAFPLARQWREAGVVYLTAIMAETSQLFLRTPVTAPEDLRGLTILTTGREASWLTALGAVPRVIGPDAAAAALENADVAGAIMPVTVAIGLGLADRLPVMVTVDFGPRLLAALVANADWWDGQPSEVRGVVVTAATGYRDYVAVAGGIAATRARERFTANGGQIVRWGFDERKAWADELPDTARAWVAAQTDAAQAQQVVDTYMAAMRRFGALPVRDWAPEDTPEG